MYLVGLIAVSLVTGTIIGIIFVTGICLYVFRSNKPKLIEVAQKDYLSIN